MSDQTETPRSSMEQSVGGGVDLRGYVNVLLRYFWLIFLVFGVVVAAGYFYAERQPEVYQAEVTLLIQPTPPSLGGGQGGEATVLMWTAYLDAQRYRSTQQRIITSRRLLEQVAEELDLYHDVEFLGLAGIEDEAELRRRLETADPVPRLRSMINVVPDSATMMVTIAATGRDPELCARVANAVSTVYVDYNYSQRIASGADAEDWIRTQFENIQEDLEESERALFDFLQENGLLSISLGDQFSQVGSTLGALQTRLMEIQFETDRRDNEMAQIRQIRESGEYLNAGITDVVDNALIQDLKGQLVTLQSERALLSATYLDEHPRMVANERRQDIVRDALEREIENELVSKAIEYESLQTMRSRLQTRYDDTFGSALEQTEQGLTYQRLQREAEANRELFAGLEARLKQVELQNELEPNNVQIMERASIPRRPTNASDNQTILLAVLLGLALGVGLAFLLEFLDNTVKTQEQLEVKFGLPFLGLVPTMRTVGGTRATKRGPIRGEDYEPDTFVHDYPRSSVAEACRSIRTNLMFLSAERPIERIMVTSPGPLEGKTTTAISLATVIAQSGKRVLLIDNDMRRPRVHKAFGVENHVGLTNLILGEETLENVAVRTKIDGVDALPCGPLPPNPTELLYTERYKNTIDMLGEAYDVLVFDSAPITPVTDSTVLSGLTDGVVLVVRASKTRKEMLARSIDQLDSVEANILGAVLNDVDITNKRYGYYYYYYRHYGSYYGTDDEEYIDQPII